MSLWNFGSDIEGEKKNKALRGIFGPKKHEMTGAGENLHN
jgi:hypothetical protein